VATAGEARLQPANTQPIAIMPFPAAAASSATDRTWPVPQIGPGGRNETKGTVSASLAPRSARQATSLPRTESSPNPQPSVTYPEPTSGSPELIRASQEILALDHALGLLRSKRDAQGALQALDDYLARFPAGVLGHEARVARVDALLMLRRSDEALLALEALPLDEHRRSAELQVIRAELRSRSDCVLAERDFTAVLARVRSAALEERARYGRASCRSRHGDIKGATEDVRRYLERFPKGTHAVWARRWLEGSND
jgi:TolA-binding protein